jgi:hypothetical protein
MLSHESPMYGAYSGWDQKYFSRVGDAAPAAANIFLEGKNLTATDIRLALLIVEFSFEDPAEIKVESDREPKAALLLLQRLQGLPAASGLKDEFVEALRPTSGPVRYESRTAARQAYPTG